jgi:hypothetical protein
VIITYHDLQSPEPLRKKGRSIHKNRNFAIDKAFIVIQGGEFGLWTGPRNDGIRPDTGQEMPNTIDSGG